MQYFGITSLPIVEPAAHRAARALSQLMTDDDIWSYSRAERKIIKEHIRLIAAAPQRERDMAELREAVEEYKRYISLWSAMRVEVSAVGN